MLCRRSDAGFQRSQIDSYCLKNDSLEPRVKQIIEACIILEPHVSCDSCGVSNRNFTRRDKLPIIRVEMFSGRTIDQKRELVRELTDAFVKTAGGTPQSIYVVITDVEKSDWGSGGELCSDKFPDLVSDDD